MQYASSIACCAALALVLTPTAAWAGPMPILPELPPLPTDYQSEGGGIYVGVLAGYTDDTETGLRIDLVVGHTFAAADLLLGIEALGLAASHGEVTAEASLRAGIPLTDTLSVFGNAGLGYSFDTDAFVSVGASVEADVGDGWMFRADYRYNHDLSGQAGTHKVLAGLLHGF